MSPICDNVLANGFAVVPAVLMAAQSEALAAYLHPLAAACSAPGTRDLVNKCPAIRELADSPAVRAMVEPLLGRQARLVRSIYFNKSPQNNWQVSWHQDLTIAVQARADLAGYGPWSIKEGIAHVQPPREVLDNMLTVRVHLDAADESNGAMWVVPGSHRSGRLSAKQVVDLANASERALCSVEAGGAMLFRPLLLHSSRKSSSERERRVIHLEFCGATLPAPIDWA